MPSLSAGILKSNNTITKTVYHKPGNTTSPKTGDNSNLLLWIVLLLASGGVLTVLGIASRKKSKNALK